MSRGPSLNTNITTMRILFDTEFTDCTDCELISIALVADDGRAFYGERTDFDRHACSISSRGGASTARLISGSDIFALAPSLGIS